LLTEFAKFRHTLPTSALRCFDKAKAVFPFLKFWIVDCFQETAGMPTFMCRHRQQGFSANQS
jgi:hypothetical protein